MTWGYYTGYIEAFLDGSKVFPAVGTISATGMAPCYACDNNTLPLVGQQGWWGGVPPYGNPYPFVGYMYGDNSNCICKPGFKSLGVNGGFMTHYRIT